MPILPVSDAFYPGGTWSRTINQGLRPISPGIGLETPGVTPTTPGETVAVRRDVSFSSIRWVPTEGFKPLTRKQELQRKREIFDRSHEELWNPIIPSLGRSKWERIGKPGLVFATDVALMVVPPLAAWNRYLKGIRTINKFFPGM